MGRYKKSNNPTRFYVYEHWRSDKNIPFYVGKGSGGRANDTYRNRSRHHQAIVAKLNLIGAFVEVRIVLKDLTEAQSFMEEETLIAHWISKGIKLANVSIGGPSGAAGIRHSEEWLERHSQRMRELMADPERRKRQGDHRRGVKLTDGQKEQLKGPKSPEHIEAMKRAAKGRKRPPPRSETHTRRVKESLAEWRATEEFERHWKERRAKAAKKRAEKETAKQLEKQQKADAAAKLRFMQLVRAIDAGTAKHCSRCDVLNAPENFTKQKAGKNGLGSYCKPCAAIKQKEFHTARRAKEALEVEE